MTEEEVILALQTEIYGETGEHEWDNTWIAYGLKDFTEAINTHYPKITLLGYFWLQEPKHWIDGLDLDIGLVCEEEYGYRFWCHFPSKFIEEMIETYKERGR